MAEFLVLGLKATNKLVDQHFHKLPDRFFTSSGSRRKKNDGNDSPSQDEDPQDQFQDFNQSSRSLEGEGYQPQYQGDGIQPQYRDDGPQHYDYTQQYGPPPLSAPAYVSSPRTIQQSPLSQYPPGPPPLSAPAYASSPRAMYQSPISPHPPGPFPTQQDPYAYYSPTYATQRSFSPRRSNSLRPAPRDDSSIIDRRSHRRRRSTHSSRELASPRDGRRDSRDDRRDSRESRRDSRRDSKGHHAFTASALGAVAGGLVAHEVGDGHTVVRTLVGAAIGAMGAGAVEKSRRKDESERRRSVDDERRWERRSERGRSVDDERRRNR